ncbi:MAG: ribose-phosphate diphosphokinase [Treponema sp.]|nr:ribose-phosphate diphosphokinase [Treponema sp.]
MNDDGYKIKVFSGRASVNFTKKICNHLSLEMGKAYSKIFSEGNIFVKIAENVRGSDVYVIQSNSRNPNNDFMELLFMIDAFKRSSAGSITAVIPYFNYAKGDKKDEPRVSIRARVCADCLESVGVDRILTMDLHSAQIQGFFKKPVDHLYGMYTLCEYIKQKNIDDLVVVSPDVGFAKTAGMYGDIIGVPVAISNKIRVAHDEKAEVTGIIGDVQGKNAIIVDDFTISCGTLIDTARVLKEMGAKSIYACVSHSLLNNTGLDLLDKSPIEELIITDTIEDEIVFNHRKIKLVSVAGLFARAIWNIHNGESLSELFM